MSIVKKKMSSRSFNHQVLIKGRKVAKLKVKKGDKVTVIAGDNKGKEASIGAVLKKDNMLSIVSKDFVKKGSKQDKHPGAILIHISNVKKID